MGENYDEPEFGEVQPMEKEPITERGQRKRNEYKNHQRIYAALDGSGDPLKLKEIIGAKTVAEVYRTLDKLTIRREFHNALTKAGITFEFLIEGIKREAIGGDKSMDRLKAYEMLLKTLGLDKYDDTSAGATSSWEERLLKAIEGHEGILDEVITPTKAKDYSVIAPQIPASVRAVRQNIEMDEDTGNALANAYPRPNNDKGGK